MRRAGRLGASVAAAVLAGCGGDDAARDSQGPKEAIVTAFTTDDARVACEQTATARLVKEVHGTPAACHEQRAYHSGADAVTVAALRVEGSHGSATIGVTGGALDGVHERVSIVREGTRWKLDRFGPDLLRAVLIAEMDDARSVLDVDTRRCAARLVTRAGDATIRNAFGDEAALGKLLTPCVREALAESGPKRTERLRSIFTASIVSGVGDIPPTTIACVRRVVEREISGQALETWFDSGASPDRRGAAVDGLEKAIRITCPDFPR